MAGGRGKRVTDEEILDTFRTTTDPVLSTREVSEAVDLGRRGAFSRLEKLAEQGDLQKKKIDERRTVWWHPDSLRQRYTV